MYKYHQYHDRLFATRVTRPLSSTSGVVTWFLSPRSAILDYFSAKTTAETLEIGCKGKPVNVINTIKVINVINIKIDALRRRSRETVVRGAKLARRRGLAVRQGSRRNSTYTVVDLSQGAAR